MCLFSWVQCVRKWYLQVEWLPGRPLSLSFNDSHYFISLQRRKEREVGERRRGGTSSNLSQNRWRLTEGKKEHLQRKGQNWQIDMSESEHSLQGQRVLKCSEAEELQQSKTYKDKMALLLLQRVLVWRRPCNALPRPTVTSLTRNCGHFWTEQHSIT